LIGRDTVLGQTGAEGERGELGRATTDQDRVGHDDLGVVQFHAPLIDDRLDRTQQVLVGAHASRDAVHDDADFVGGHWYKKRCECGAPENRGNWSVRGRKAYPNARLAVRTIPTPPSTYPPPRHPLAMLAWSPLLVQKIEIHALGFVLRKLQLNRHRDAEVASHRHPYHQLILYLAGEGVQVLRDKRVDARA